MSKNFIRKEPVTYVITNLLPGQWYDFPKERKSTIAATCSRLNKEGEFKYIIRSPKGEKVVRVYCLPA